MIDMYLGSLKKYVTFSGRARRRELLIFALGNTIIYALLVFVDGLIGIGGALGVLFGLGVLLPTLAASVRRLHDTGRSGWWLLIGLVPILGALALLFFYVQPGHPGDNQYGSNPKEMAAE
jgi:uncharacterized membrane protein YhaH (DUF805 family)